MKKLIALFMVAVVIGVVKCNAWEYPQNPDRFPSIGLNLSGENGTGDVKYPSMPALGSQDLSGTSSAFILDTRLPLSNSFTLNLALGGTSSELKGDANATFESSKQTMSGGIFNIGVRYYFNK